MQAKECSAIGLTRQQWWVRHKSHINKVMALAVVAFAFEDTPENGGVAVKISLAQAQASRIAGKAQRAYSGMNEEGGRMFRGDVIRRKGDAYSVDTTITGSDEGTSENPKLSLKRVFKEVVFEQVDKMVAMGAPLEGYKPVYQGDKAGPHEEAEFQRFVKQHCADNNSAWESQAPQMPYSNVLDLVAFPCMSKRHSALTRRHTGSVASRDVIWNCAEKVWRDLPECKIARAFILVWRIAALVI